MFMIILFLLIFKYFMYALGYIFKYLVLGYCIYLLVKKIRYLID